MRDLKRLIFDFEDQSGVAVSAPSRVRQVDFGSQTDEVRHHRTKITQTDGRFKNKAWPATHSPSTTGVRLPCVGPAAPVWTHGIVQSALPAPIVWMPVQVPSLVMGGSHSAQILQTPCHIDHSFAAMPSLGNVWTGYPMAANRHTPSIEAERPVSVRQPHCPLSAPPGLDLTLGKSYGDVLVAPAGFCLQSGELQTAAPSSANDMLDADSSSASGSAWWVYPSDSAEPKSLSAAELEGSPASLASPETSCESIDADLDLLKIPSVVELQRLQDQLGQ